MGSKRIVAVASTLTVLGLLSTCTPVAAPTPVSQVISTPAAKPTTPEPTPRASEEPRYGGTLSLPSHSDPPNLDPHLGAIAVLSAFTAPIYSGIVQYDQSNKVVPDLADRWDVSADGKVLTFRLREGVKWHDGKPFTSTDAKFSLERTMASDALKFITEAVDKVESPDDSSLKITLMYRQAGFLPLIGHGRTLIGPKHVIEAKGDLKRDAIGTGPFKFKQYISGVSLETEKNRDYFVKGRPYLDKLTFFIIKDFATRFAAFRTGRVQIYGHPPVQGELKPTHIDILKRDMPQGTVKPYDVMQYYGLLPNWNRTPWNDLRVRRAAFLAVDRERGLELVSEGVGNLGISLFYGEWALPKEELMRMPGFRKPKDEDIAEAKRLLAEAGYPQGLKSTILLRAGVPVMEKGGTFMKDQLAKVGIDLTLQTVEFAIFADARSKRNYDTMLVEIYLPLPDPDVSNRYISWKMGGIFASSDDDQIQELFARQSQAASVEERREIVFALQRRIAEVVPHIGIAWGSSFIAFWPEVKNYTAQSSVYSHNKLEDIWLIK